MTSVKGLAFPSKMQLNPFKSETAKLKERRLELQEWLTNTIGLRADDSALVEFLSGRAPAPAPELAAEPASAAAVVSDTASEGKGTLGLFETLLKTTVRSGSDTASDKTGTSTEGARAAPSLITSPHIREWPWLITWLSYGGGGGTTLQG